MSSKVWLSLSATETKLLCEALATYSSSKVANKRAANKLSQRVARANAHPDITIGVYGGQVQWSLGNPFPIRICDYDGEDRDLPHVDERGQRCRTWFESANLRH